jgi:drug/metabolite transporter (DMT)-like permease
MAGHLRVREPGGGATLLGYFLGGEALGLRTILGTALVLISVVVITTTRAKKRVGAEERKI